MMPRYNIPKRLFMKGEKRPVTVRMPNDLKQALEAISKESGRSFTDLILTILDQFIQAETRPDKKK